MLRVHINPDGTEVTVPDDLIAREGTHIGYVPDYLEGADPNRFDIGSSVTIGEDCKIEPGAVIGDGVIIGQGCLIEHAVTVGHGAVIGNNVTLIGRVSIGERAYVHNDVRITGYVDIGRECVVTAGSTIDLEETEMAYRLSGGQTVTIKIVCEHG